MADQVTKIYRFEEVGFIDVKNKLISISELFKEITRQKKELNALRTTITDPRELDNVIQKLAELTRAEENLKKTREDGKSTGDSTAKSYIEVVKAYKAAKDQVAELTIEYGKNSDQAKAAAISAAGYKKQLLEIKEVLAQGEAVPTQDQTVINQQKAQEAAEAQRLQAAAIQETLAGYQALQVPLQEYTGSLTDNIAKNAQYKNRLAEISAELRTSAKTTDTAGKNTDAYKNKVAALTTEQGQLKLKSAELNQTISAQQKFVGAAAGSYDALNAELILSKSLYKSLTDEQKASAFGQQLTSRIQVLDVTLKKDSATIGEHQRNVGNYQSVFGKLFGYLRTAANILPGLGISGIILLLTEGIQKVYQYFTNASNGLSAYTERLNAFNEINKEANKSAGEQLATLKLLNAKATNPAAPMKDRVAAVQAMQKLFPEYFKNVSQEAILNGEAKKSYDDLAKSIIDSSKAKAAKGRVDEIEAQKLDANNEIEKILNAGNNRKSKLVNIPTTVKGTANGAFTVQGQTVAEQAQVIDAETKGAIDKVNARIKILDNTEKFVIKYAGLNKITKQIEDDQLKKLGKGKADSVRADLTNQLNTFDAAYKIALSKQNETRAEAERNHTFSLEAEKTYLANINKLNTDYLTSKINYLEGQKKLNTREQVERASLYEQRSAAALKAQKDQETIDKKIFEQRAATLKQQYDEERAAIQRQNDMVQNDPKSSNVQKLQAKITADSQLLGAQKFYNDQLDALEKEQHQHSVDNALKTSEELDKIKADQLQSSRALGKAELDDIQANTDKQVALIKARYDRLKLEVLKSKKNVGSKDAALQTLDKAENLAVAAEVQNGANKALEVVQKLFDEGKITEAEFTAIFEAAVKGQKNLNDAIKAGQQEITSFQVTISNRVGNILGFASGSQQAKVFAEAVSTAFNSASQAENQYFSNRMDRIARDNAATLKQLDIQQQAALARATSTAQEDRINAQFQAKRDAANKKAFELQKRQQLAQAAINLAMQLSNLALLAAAPSPANVLSLGLAGQIAFAVQAAAAYANFFLSVSKIRNATYEFGGQVPKRGGRFGGKRHSEGGTPFNYAGNNYEAEIDELAIIRTRNAPSNRKFTISGTHTQIASALNQLGGGVSFDNGARVHRYSYGGAVPGSTLSAPLYIPSRTSAGSGDSQVTIQRLETQNALLAAYINATNNRIDMLQVQQVTSSVTNAQRKEVNQRSVATIGRRN